MKKIILSSLILLNFAFLTKNISAGGYAEPVVYYDYETNYYDPVIQPDENFPEPSAPPSPTAFDYYTTEPNYTAQQEQEDFYPLYPSLDFEPQDTYSIEPPPLAVAITPKNMDLEDLETTSELKKPGFFSKVLTPFKFIGRTVQKTYNVTKIVFLMTTLLYIADYALAIGNGNICKFINQAIALPFHAIKGAKANSLSEEKIRSIIEQFKPITNVNANIKNHNIITRQLIKLVNLIKNLLNKIIVLIFKSKTDGAKALKIINKTILKQKLSKWQKFKALTVNVGSNLRNYNCLQRLNAQAQTDMSGLTLDNLGDLVDSYYKCTRR
ncbi:hypothetical protein K9L05_04440 [Candidatus Babeliales bacterium]|nr:hypothetical protein [Candidatus Babeliales bacterium]MCF7899860.1 hypothetical protein [Candidatus Babeliales bacterium]